MTRHIADLRQDYARQSLDLADVATEPIAQFTAWFDDVLRAELPEPNAMTLATVRDDGTPDARIVLLKGVDARGFTFYTDHRSQKGRDLAAHAHAALVFHWHALERQVRIRGTVTMLPTDESAAYYASRPIGSRIGAWASVQSSVLPDRATLDARVREAEARFAHDAPPLPPHWGGYIVSPVAVEFWQGRPSRLHDRLRYTRHDDAWRIERLSP